MTKKTIKNLGLVVISALVITSCKETKPPIKTEETGLESLKEETTSVKVIEVVSRLPSKELKEMKAKVLTTEEYNILKESIKKYDNLKTLEDKVNNAIKEKCYECEAEAIEEAREILEVKAKHARKAAELREANLNKMSVPGAVKK